MKERPILFSAPMVRAILEGRKTQTRRVVKHYGISNVRRVSGPCSKLGDFDFIFPHEDEPTEDGNGHIVACPYGKSGDRLWVRETFGERLGRFWYRADPMVDDCVAKSTNMKWKPSIFMRRGQSRITLEITGVRVDRLQEISESDAIAEGIAHFYLGPAHDVRNPTKWGIEKPPFAETPNDAYATLWDKINTKRAPWASNPWVWCISFLPLP
jgi:hypothetical protein